MMGKKFVVFGVLLGLLALVAPAQRLGVGTLTGTVRDADGQSALSGVTVRVKSAALILPQVATRSGVNGVFHFPDLPPGLYDVTFQIEGFRTLMRGIRVHAMRATTLDVRLAPRPAPAAGAPAAGEQFAAPAAEPVAEPELVEEVPQAPAMAAASLVPVEAGAGARTEPPSAMDLLPVPASLPAPAGLAPLPGLSGELTAPPPPASWFVLVPRPLPRDLAEEMVVLRGHEPQADSRRVARTVTLTREWLAALPGYRDLSAFVNMAPGLVAAPDQTSLAHGSSAMDNSVNLDGISMVDPVTATPYVPFFDFNVEAADELVVQSGALAAEHGQARGAVIQVVPRRGGETVSGAVTFYFNDKSFRGDNTRGTVLEGAESGSKYDYQPAFALGGRLLKERLWFSFGGSYMERATEVAGFPYDDPGSAANKDVRPSAFLRLTLQATPASRLSLFYSYGATRQDNLDASAFATEESTVNQNSLSHAVGLQWTQMVGGSAWAGLRVSLMRFRMDLNAKSGQPQYQDFNTQRIRGGFWRNQDENVRNRFALQADATLVNDGTMGSHQLQAGAGLEQARVQWRVQTARDAASGAAYNVMLGSRYYYGLVLVNDGFDRLENESDLYAYLQDAWTVNRRLTLNLGLRLQRDAVVWPAQNQSEGALTMLGRTYDRGIAEAIKPLQWTTLSPRLGLVFDLAGDGVTLFKAGWSRTIAPNQVGWVNTAHPNSWLGYLQYFTSDGTPVSGLAMVWSAPGAVAIGYGDLKLKAPTTNEMVLAVERQLGRDWSVGARYIRKQDRNLIHVVDAAQLDMDKLLADGTLDWSRNWTAVQVTDPATGQPLTFWNIVDASASDKHLINPPGAVRDYTGLEFTVSRRPGRALGLEASYVYGKSSGLINTVRSAQSLGISTLFSDPNAHTNADGLLEPDCTHQLKVLAMLRAPLGFRISGYYRYLSGNRWTRTVTSSQLGLRLRQGTTTINAEERGARRLPAANLLDLRLEKSFRIHSLTISLFADVFNAFNQGVATSVWTDSSQTATPLGQMLAISAPRTIQLGLRFGFNQ